VIVGGGIAGASLAWRFVRRGRKVTIIERSERPEGASLRSLGMLWRIGQADPATQALAAESARHWKEASEQIGFWRRECGSLHLAYEDLELTVLEEFHSTCDPVLGRKVISPSEAASICPVIRKDGLKGALYSPTETAVDPRSAVQQVLSGLAQMGVEVRFNSRVSQILAGKVVLSDGSEVEGSQTIVCAGPELYDLLPDHYKRAELEECRLQMLRLRPKPGTQSLGIHLCAGLTLGHYKNFAQCPSLPKLNELHKEKWSGQVQAGVHVLVSEHEDGCLTVGDSHAYGRSGPIYREDAIDELILDALDEFLPRDLYCIEQRWMGRYLTHPSRPYVCERLDEGLWNVSLFGTGMTLSFGVTSQLASQLDESL